MQQITDQAGFESAQFAQSKVSLVQRARVCAQDSFANVLRKTPAGAEQLAEPFFEHLDEVSQLLRVAGYDDEVQAAGLLHDHIEDLEDWDATRIQELFNTRVAYLVWNVTQHNKAESWEQRNKDYMFQLLNAPVESKAISCADKISNIRSTLKLVEIGYPVNHFLKNGWEVNSQKWHELLDAVRDDVEGGLVSTLISELTRFDILASQAERRRYMQLVNAQVEPIVGDLVFVKPAGEAAPRKLRIEQVERASDGELLVRTVLDRSGEARKWCDVVAQHHVR